MKYSELLDPMVYQVLVANGPSFADLTFPGRRPSVDLLPFCQLFGYIPRFPVNPQHNYEVALGLAKFLMKNESSTAKYGHTEFARLLLVPSHLIYKNIQNYILENNLTKSDWAKMNPMEMIPYLASKLSVPEYLVESRMVELNREISVLGAI